MNTVILKKLNQRVICSCADFCDKKNRMAIKSCESNSNCVILIAAVSWVQTNGSEQDSGMHHSKEKNWRIDMRQKLQISSQQENDSCIRHKLVTRSWYAIAAIWSPGKSPMGLDRIPDYCIQ